MFGATTRRFTLATSTRAFSTSVPTGYQTRLSQFYHNTLRDDLVIMQYVPPSIRARQDANEAARIEATNQKIGGTPPNPDKQHKKTRQPKPKVPVTSANNAPHMESVTVHIRCREALQNKHHLLSVLMAMQIVTGQRGEVIKSKNDAATWKLRKGMPISVKVELKGDRMFEFMDKLVEVVLPRMKEYHGLGMDAGDGNGNFSMGFDGSVIGLFPEMEMVYDQFPLVTGFHVNVRTSAARNPAGRLLLSGFGLPFIHTRKPASETFEL
ncbi:ribosomal protein L5 domain-containing protein [Kickxella alabastrina]|uniref:ribosomal protein L5 domain-containing protein n=1 Tax=Kickxella alabastrina TaxID=61397 RepID=UPI00221FFE28|nr:ribosomal protein L5 domain-containing protein [Kickxella alabastrina]KAI7834944.1 ribosomal protein L5 domain-containing protein [Kickxella alabastrina]KAJ1947892.1 ribosomal protein [Kickxella alabastrina]